jgi:hypothetical protein
VLYAEVRLKVITLLPSKERAHFREQRGPVLEPIQNLAYVRALATDLPDDSR